MATSLGSLRPSLARAFCKRQLDTYLSSASRYAHSVASTPSTSVRSSRTKPKGRAETAEPSPVSPHYGKLKPYDLSKRLNTLIQKGEIDEAITMLKNMPLAAQNVSVWNTVIKAAFDAGKLKLAYSLHTDMKRRGFRPNLRSYTTMISGYHRIRSWDGLENQLQNVHSVYRHFTAYIEDVPDSLESGKTPHAVRAAMSQYLDICCNARMSTELEEAFERIPVNGPLARDVRMYAPYLRDLLQRKLPPATLAAAVRQVWKEVLEMQEKDTAGEPRTFAILADLTFRGLTQSPNIADHDLAFDIVRDVFALRSKGEVLPSAFKGIPMLPLTAVHVLTTANLLGRPGFVLDFARLVSRRDNLQDVLNMTMVHQVLSASREVSRRDNATVLSELVQAVAARHPRHLDQATMTIQGILKACLDCRDFTASKDVIASVLRLRPSELISAVHTSHAKSVTTTSWSYFAHCALHGKASDATLALVVLETQAGHLIEDVTSQPLKGGFRAALAQTLMQLAESNGRSHYTLPWYKILRAKVDAYMSEERPYVGSTTLSSGDPFAPGAVVDSSLEIDALGLTEDVVEPHEHTKDSPVQAAGSG